MKAGQSKADYLIVGQHYPALDGLRGIACLLVLWFHASYFSYELVARQIGDAAELYVTFSLLGETGVDLFFVLSGFLITGILMDTQAQDGCLKKFYLRRSLRIFPLYYASLFLVFVLASLFMEVTRPATNFLTHFFYIQNWTSEHATGGFMLLNHTWSLAVEEQFYLIWPFIFLLAYKRSAFAALMLCAGVVAVSIVARLWLAGADMHKLAHTSTIACAAPLVMGAMLSVMLKHYRDLVLRMVPLVKYFVAVCVVLTVGWAASDNGGVMDKSMAFIHYGLIGCTFFYAAILLYVSVSPEKKVSVSWLRSVFLRKIGRISYGMYIFHAPIMMVLAILIRDIGLGFWLNQAALLFVGGFLSYGAAALSYRFFERPILSLKDKVAAY